MITVDPPSSTRRSRGYVFYFFVFCVGLPLLVAAFAVVFFVGREFAARRALEHRLEAIRAEGLPVDNASVTAYYETLTSTEDTRKWLALLNDLTSEKFSQTTSGVPFFDPHTETEVPPPGEPWPQEASTREFLQKWEELHERTQQLAIDAEAVRFPIEFKAHETLLDETQNLRQAARLLNLRGQVAVYDRDSTGAREAVEALFGCSRVTQGEPILVSQLVSIAIDSLALNLLKRSLEHDVLEQEDLEKLLPEVLARTTIGPGWQRGIIGERAMSLATFDGVKMPLRSRDKNYMMGLTAAVLEVPTDDLDRFRAGVQRIGESFNDRMNEAGRLEQFDLLMTALLTPAYSAAADAFLRQALMHRLAALAISVRLYEDERGRFPESLQPLSQYVRVEQLTPLGGKPFGYTIHEGDAVLWGFPITLEEESSVPDEMPVVRPDDLDADVRRLWIWKLEDR